MLGPTVLDFTGLGGGLASALLSAPDTNSGTPAVVAHNENSDDIADATK